MNANKYVLGSDLARVDAHVIADDEYDDAPELTDEDLARATWKIGDKAVTETADTVRKDVREEMRGMGRRRMKAV